MSNYDDFSFTSSVAKSLSQIENQIQTVADTLAESGLEVEGLNMQQLLQKANSELRRLRHQDEVVRDLGYSSFNNLAKGLKMTSLESNRTKKNFSYYEGKLDPALVTIPAELLFVERHNDRTRVKRFLLETLYPTFEMYMKSKNKSLEKLIEKWKQTENINSLIDLNNWCIEEIRNEDEPLDEGDMEFWSQAVASLLKQPK